MKSSELTKEQREHYQRRQRLVYWQRKEEAVAFFGNRCVICRVKGRNSRGLGLGFHHLMPAGEGESQSKRNIKAALEHPERFVLLCRPCHNAIHTLGKSRNLDALAILRNVLCADESELIRVDGIGVKIAQGLLQGVGKV